MSKVINHERSQWPIENFTPTLIGNAIQMSSNDDTHTKTTQIPHTPKWIAGITVES